MFSYFSSIIPWSNLNLGGLNMFLFQIIRFLLRKSQNLLHCDREEESTVGLKWVKRNIWTGCWSGLVFLKAEMSFYFVCFSPVCGPMPLTGKIQLKTTSLHQQRALMWSSRQVRFFFLKFIQDFCHFREIHNNQRSSLNSLSSYVNTLLSRYLCRTSGAWVVLDSSTPPLNKLTVVGVLEIPDSTNSSSSRTARAAPESSAVVLDAVYISIQVSATENLSDYPDYHFTIKVFQVIFAALEWRRTAA